MLGGQRAVEDAGPYKRKGCVFMTIHTLTLGAYQVNCCIVANESRCVVIDPGCEPEKILDFLRNHQLQCDAILLTHGHFDHVGAVEALVAATGCTLWMSEGDWSQFPNPVTAYFYPLANCDFTEIHFCEDGEIIQAAGLRFEALATPGHTWGSMCFLCGDALFTGDTLFAGSCGRTDLPGGDQKTLTDSLTRLKELDGDFSVYPGHGPATTLKREKKTNPYL